MILDDTNRQWLAHASRFGDVRWLPAVDSTNRYLLDLARAGAPEGVVVVADHQSAGRGRRGRSWDSEPGAALLVSILLRPDPAVVPPDRRWWVSAAVALAAAEACGPAAAIKWPNDLIVGDRKLAGILAEADRGAVVVGVGINTSAAPPGAACLGPGVDRGQLLTRLLVNLERWCRRWEEAGAEYRVRCATVGRRVRVELAAGAAVLSGTAEGIDPDGRLLVATEAGVQAVSVADVVHLRPGIADTQP